MGNKRERGKNFRKCFLLLPPTLLLACGGLAFTSSKKVASYSARRPAPWLGRNWSAYSWSVFPSSPHKANASRKRRHEGRNITTVIYWIFLPKGDLGLFVGRCRLLLGPSRSPPPHFPHPPRQRLRRRRRHGLSSSTISPRELMVIAPGARRRGEAGGYVE